MPPRPPCLFSYICYFASLLSIFPLDAFLVIFHEESGSASQHTSAEAFSGFLLFTTKVTTRCRHNLLLREDAAIEYRRAGRGRDVNAMLLAFRPSIRRSRRQIWWRSIIALATDVFTSHFHYFSPHHAYLPRNWPPKRARHGLTQPASRYCLHDDEHDTFFMPSITI